jgi:hypothetical protein
MFVADNHWGNDFQYQTKEKNKKESTTNCPLIGPTFFNGHCIEKGQGFAFSRIKTQRDSAVLLGQQ